MVTALPGDDGRIDGGTAVGQAGRGARAIVTHAHCRPPAARGTFSACSYTAPESRIETRRFGALAYGELRIEIDRVLVMGAGPIGLFAAMLCRQLFGAASVDVVEPAKFRRHFARKWADRVYDVDESLGASISGPYDVMVEASGALGKFDVTLRRMAANARVVLLARGIAPLHVGALDHVVTNGLCITGSRGHPGGAFETILSLCLAERLPLHEVVTGVLRGLDAIHSTLEQPLPLREQHCKLQVRL